MSGENWMQISRQIFCKFLAFYFSQLQMRRRGEGEGGQPKVSHLPPRPKDEEMAVNVKIFLQAFIF